MITLKTGIIGSGKSLSAVEELSKLLSGWQSSSKEADRRPVYVHGIRGLALDHLPLPIYPVKGNPGDAVELDPMGRPMDPIAVDWASVPDGALVVLDECQDAYPPRGNGTRTPDHVAWLQRSRHHGVDVVLITQHPRLIDSTVRAFVGKHEHYRRIFGGSRAVVYEWDTCSDGLSYRTATKRFWPYPRRAFRWYKSAEEHRKQSFKLPAWLLVPVMGIVVGVMAAPNAWHALHGAATGKGIGQDHAPSTVSASGSPSPAAGTLAVSAASAPGPVVDHVMAAKAGADGGGGREDAHDGGDSPQPQGCIADSSRCRCFAGGRLVEKEQQACRDAISTAGKVMPLDQVPILRGMPDSGPEGRYLPPVAMSDVRSRGDGVYRGRSPGERQDQAWQTRVIKQADAM